LLEAVGAAGDCVLVLIVAFVFGYRATFGQPWVAFAGLAIGEIGAAVYFGLANYVGRSTPALLDARLVGVYFMALVFAAGLCGLAGSWFGYRKSMGGGLF
jgi:hypothetical protein